jgi:hypothetical protein
VRLDYHHRRRAVHRSWTFTDREMVIEDRIEGTGQHRLSRFLHTPWPTKRVGERVHIMTPEAEFILAAETPPHLEERMCWQAYGKGVPGRAIRFDAQAALPWNGRIHIEVR